MSSNDVPRRVRIDKFTPAEKAIYDACWAAEEDEMAKLEALP